MYILNVGYSHKGTNARLYSLLTLGLRQHGIKSDVYTYFDNNVKGDFIYSEKGISSRKKLILKYPKMLIDLYRINANIYHIHEPLLLPIGIILRILGKKIVYDVHEEYAKYKYKNNITLSYSYRVLEFIFSRFSNLTTIVIEKFSKRYIGKPLVIHNYVLPQHITKKNEIKEVKRDEKLKCIYHGSLSINRGILSIIEASSKCKYPVEITIVGKWNKNIEELCKNIEGWENIIKVEYMDHQDILKFIPNFDLGLQLVHNQPYLQGSHPMKVIEFMASGVPTLVSNHSSKMRTFENASEYVNAESIDDIAKKIDFLHLNLTRRIEMHKLGLILYEEKFNSSIELKSLIKRYQSI